ncbi:DUF1707 domain-containing protein [Nonomuraea sp. NPDC059194]|uniref:DUF1707 domain-containing protein n=1 Tax=Nonomuraea sp. NPDC059194 TaxID=3346764 RepID=UPI0036B172A8
MTSLPERDPREMRAADLDRERTAEILRTAAGDGRLGMEEFHERLDQVYTAKTYAELDLLTHDLPTPSPSAPFASSMASGSSMASDKASGVAVGVMGGFKRTGIWRAPRLLTGVAFWGGGKIDLRDAVLNGGQITIRAFAVMGGIEIVVPEDAEVDVTGIGVMGGFDHAAAGAGAPGAPRIRVTGFAFWGGVDVKRKRRKR